ncbi:MAG: hypothetical protein Q4E87_05415 [bacterium]|nr:hypothetical protein [bacterium]
MDEKLPYYMAYPMPLLYDDERQNQRDYEYMKSVYPGTAKRLVPYIEEECDRLEYTGSVMYDEYPDRLQLRLLCRRIYNRAKEEEMKEEGETGEWLEDLIQVMTYQELCQRRREQRSVRRKYY